LLKVKVLYDRTHVLPELVASYCHNPLNCKVISDFNDPDLRVWTLNSLQRILWCSREHWSYVGL